MKRADVHAALRQRGWGDDLDALIALLESQKAKLNRVIALAEQAKADLGRETVSHRVTLRILDALASRAKAYLRSIEGSLDRPIMHETRGDLGRWGRNGNAPAIDDILSSAEFHSRMANVEAIEAARHVLTDRVVRAA